MTTTPKQLVLCTALNLPAEYHNDIRLGSFYRYDEDEDGYDQPHWDGMYVYPDTEEFTPVNTLEEAFAAIDDIAAALKAKATKLFEARAKRGAS